jgi:hypothetical protein
MTGQDNPSRPLTRRDNEERVMNFHPRATSKAKPQANWREE